MPGFILGFDLQDIDNEKNVPTPALPIYTYTWDLQNFVGSTPSNSSKSELLYVKEITLPDFSVDVEEVLASSIKYKYAKSVNWGDVKITFYATGDLIRSLDTMKNAVWTPETGIQSAVNYKRDTIINQWYSDDGITIKNGAAQWALKGSWIKQLTQSNLTYSNSDVHNVVTTVAYDWATVDQGSF